MGSNKVYLLSLASLLGMFLAYVLFGTQVTHEHVALTHERYLSYTRPPVVNQPIMEVAQSLTLNKTLLIFAKQRTGSTFVSSFFAADPDMSYLFEPLNSLDLITSRPAELLEEFLVCNFSRALDNPTDARWRRIWMGAMFCKFKDIKRTTATCGDDLDTDLWRRDCLRRSHMTSKVINLSDLSDITDMMEKGLHVVVLLRDPRGVMMSREGIGNYRNETPPNGFHRGVSRYCDNMLYNMWWIRGNYEKISKQLTVLRYEDVAYQPKQEIGRIYRFIGREMPISVVSWFETMTSGHNSTHAKPGDYDINRADPQQTAWAWRQRMTTPQLEDVQTMCGELMRIAGYRPVSSLMDLRDTRISLQKNIDWSTYFKTDWGVKI